MIELLTNPAFLALIGTVFGGAGLKFVEWSMNRSKTEADVAGAIRQELRTDVEALRAAVRAEEQEADQWREKYWAEVENRAQDKAAAALRNHKVKQLARVIQQKHPEVNLNEIFELPD